jgi:methionyl-tRNA synthetase
VAILGNFVNRAMVLTQKYFNGVVPEASELQAIDSDALAEIRRLKAEVENLIEDFHFRDALRETMNMARVGNKYLQETEPWKVAKTGDMARTATILHTALQITASLAIAFEPFLPFMSEKLRRMLGMAEIKWEMLGSDTLIAAGTTLGAPELLFEKVEDEAIKAQTDRLARIKQENEAAAWKPEPQAADVDIDTFARCDIRVGTVTECIRVPKADKLLQFTINDGTGKPRTIVSGIAKYYQPEALVGKQVCFIANLPARKLRGVESNGMILSAVSSDGSLVVIGPTGAVAPGSKVG